ncbi:MAG TPA: type II CAAX endopeptidase family protein [Candidatus Limnocylindrales bacterium]
MTGPTGDEPSRPGGDDREGSPAAGEPVRTDGAEAPARPGTRTFTIEGRHAPGLFVVGWIATILGLGVVAIGLGSGGSIPAPLFVVGILVLALGLLAGAGSQAIERRASGASFVGPSPFLLFAAVIPTYILLLIGILFVLSVAGVEPGAPVATLLSEIVLLGVYLGLIRLTVVGTGGASWAELGLRRPEERSAVAFGVIFAIPLVFISGLIAVLLVQVFPAPPSPLPEAHDRLGMLANLLAASVVAPIGEELFFRGYATTAWLRTMGPWAAIIRGGLFFAFAHVITVSGPTFGEAAGQAFVAFAVRVPVALALGWLFVRTRSVYPTIALHATFNGLPLLLALAGAG